MATNSFLRPLSRLSKTRAAHDRRGMISTYGYTQAKALVYSQYGDPAETLTLHKHSISPAHGTNVTIRFLSTPLNPADINQIQGTYPSLPPFTSDLGTAQPSAVGGNEGVAEVIAVGSGVKTVAKGDWVIMRQTGVGTWRTHAQLDEGRLMRVEKDGLTPNQIGSVSVNPTTAYQMLQAFGDMKAGEWYVQNGANSGVGRAAVQLGKMWGFNSLCIVRQREGVEMLKEELMALGATRVVTDEEVLTQGFQDRVKEWTRGGREEMKLGLNCVGGKVTTRMAGLLSSGGYFITYGAMSKQPFPIPAGLYIFKDLTFKGFWVSRWSNANPEEKKRVVEELLGLMRDGKFKDTPVEEFEWKKETTLEELRAVIGGTLEGFRGGKSVFLHR